MRRPSELTLKWSEQTAGEQQQWGTISFQTHISPTVLILSHLGYLNQDGSHGRKRLLQYLLLAPTQFPCVCSLAVFEMELRALHTLGKPISNILWHTSKEDSHLKKPEALPQADCYHMRFFFFLQENLGLLYETSGFQVWALTEGRAAGWIDEHRHWLAVFQCLICPVE